MRKKLKWNLRLKLLVMRTTFKVLSCLAPPLGSRLALKLFSTPPRYAVPRWKQAYIDSAKKTTVPVKNNLITFYQWGEGDATVLLTHGWGGDAVHLGAFIEPLTQAGYRVIAFDGPAHGKSQGKQCDAIDFAAVINVAVQMGEPVDAIIGHSFGAACALFAMYAHQIKVPKLILIGCPGSALWVMEDFAKKLHIPSWVMNGMRKRLEKRYHHRWSWDDLSFVEIMKKIKVPVLLIHDRKDDEVPCSQALDLFNAGETAELHLTEGLGHRYILRAHEVVDKSLNFIKKPFS
ncbi:MAG: alpha/beta hydrolase [Gammaproteobacteria bacterium]